MNDMLPPKEFNQALSTCWRRLQSGRRIVVHRSLIEITGNLKTATYLSQLLYWLRVGINVEIRNGWIFKSIAETEEETGLTKREQGLCKDKLAELNLIETARIGQGARLAVRVNMDALSNAICDHFGLDSITQLTIEEWRKQELGFIRDYFSDSIVYHLDLVWLTGDIHAAVILSNALHQSARRATLHNPFVQQRLYYSATIKEWEDATMLGYKPQQRTRIMLKNAGLLIEKHYEQSARIFSHIDGVKLMAMLDKKISLAQKPEMRLFVLKKQSQISGSDILENSEDTEYVQAGSGQDLRSNKLANSEVTKGESQKFRSYKRRKSEVTNWRNIYRDNYKHHPLDDITTTTPTDTANSADSDVVVVNDSVISSTKDDSRRFDGLVYPSLLSKMTENCRKVFTRYYPDGGQEQYQEILDEIAGQTKPVSSPLGLLTHLCKQAAATDGLICNFAPIVKKQREESLKLRAAMAVQNEKTEGVPSQNSKEAIKNGLNKLLKQICKKNPTR